MTLGFGKHANVPLEDLETGYIEWALENVDFERRGDYGMACEEELQNQLQMRRGFGVVRKTGRPDPGFGPADAARLRERLAARKRGEDPPERASEAAGEAEHEDPLGWVADCSCGRSRPVSGPSQLTCGGCGRTVAPKRL